MINQTIPKTDQDVVEQINTQYHDADLKRSMIGIFRCRRGLGDDVLTAFEYTLKAHVGALSQ